MLGFRWPELVVLVVIGLLFFGPKRLPEIGASVGNRASDRQADRRIVDRRFAVRAVIVHGVSEPRERLAQMFFQQKARMIGANRDSHSEQLYYVSAISNAVL